MPLIKIDHVVSFSTEDPVHIVNNILSTDTSKKWKCKTAGEKNAVVVLQLEKASVITGIDIGNEHSAYIEVLVSRSGTSDDYKVLLVMSSFMTPLESRQSLNVNKVRMFTKDQLSMPECEEKWDRIKIVCTQPFNKHVQYGLSFVNFHTSEGKPAVASTQPYIGKFLVRPDSPDDISVGSLFSKRKEQKQEERLTGAAAIREAGSSSSLAIFGSPVCKPKLKTQESEKPTVTDTSSEPSHSINKNNAEVKCSPKPRLRDEILYSKDEEERNEKIDTIMERNAKKAEKTNDKTQSPEKASKKKQSLKNYSENHNKKDRGEKGRTKALDTSLNSVSKTGTHNNREKDKELKRKNKDQSEDRKQTKKLKKDRITKPFARLLEGVTIVISGIQNPDRANLRALALSMGARYKTDWDNSCTHLICAFTNTPKFNQVKGKGKIVKRTWIEECHGQRKRLPWRRYALDKNDLGKDESEDEIWETVASQEPSDPGKDSETSSDIETPSLSDHKEDASDTEERLAKIFQRNQKRKDDEKEDSKPNIYLADTDEEDDCDDVTASERKYKLLDIFDGKVFYIDQTFQEEKYDRLKKYIVAYKGTVLDSPVDDIDIIITTRTNSNTLKEINSTAQCVSSDWIWKSHNSQKLVLIDDYLL